MGPGAAGGEVREEGGVEVGEEGAGGGVGEEGGEGVEVLVPLGAEGRVSYYDAGIERGGGGEEGGGW